MINKVLTLESAIETVGRLKATGYKVVFTNGCFDILHAGHVIYLRQARTLGDYLVLGLNSDSSVETVKGPLRPLVPQKERATVLSGLEFIDMVVIFDDSTPEKLLYHLEPDIHVKGGDYKAEDLPEYEVIKSYGGQVQILPFLPGSSTTNIVDTIIERYCPKPE